MEHWECRFCTALNAETNSQCWKCEKTRHEAESANKEAIELAEAARQVVAQQRAETKTAAAALASSGRLSFREYLAQYAGTSIAINVADPVHAETALLRSSQADHFEVQHGDSVFRIPYAQILKISERTSKDSKARVALVIEIFHLVVYKGSVGFGFSLPL
jgi:hypothetical protein